MSEIYKAFLKSWLVKLYPLIFSNKGTVVVVYIYTLQGVVKNFSPWVPNFSNYQFGRSGCCIKKHFTYLYRPFISSKSVGSISYFSKICGFTGTHGTHANYALALFSLIDKVTLSLTVFMYLEEACLFISDSWKNRFII